MIKVFNEFLYRYFSTKYCQYKKKYVISYLIIVRRQIGIQIQKEKKIKVRKQTKNVIIGLLMESASTEH